MGEARRRRAAGIPPRQAEETRAEDFRVPAGRLALTLDIEGVNPSTCIMDPAAVPAVLELVDREMTRLRIPYGSAVAGLAAEFRSARRQGDDGAMAGIGPACLWLAFNHPQTGALMRERVSDALRREGKAHLTLTVAGERLCLALGPQFVDAVPLMEAMPADCVVVAPERAPCGTTH
jgi:hypothetical protein